MTPTFRITLVLIAVLDLGLRFVDELLGLAFSSLSLTIGAGLLNVTQWALFLVALALLVPRLYPSPLGDLTKDPSLRLILAASGTGIAIVLTDIDGLDDAGLFGAIVVVFVVAVTATLRLKEVPVFAEESPLVAGLNWFSPTDGTAERELADAKDYDGWRRLVALGIFWMATQVVLIVPILIASIIVTMLAGTFPIPDLLVITYGLSVFVAPRTDRFSGPPAALHVDEYLLTFARQATNGIHGVFVVLLYGLGLLVTVTTPIVALRPATELLVTAFELSVGPLLLWNVVGLSVLYLGGVAYGLWFWLRSVPRVIAFLERWNGEPHKTPLEARPKSLLLPSFVVTSIASAGIANGFLAENRYLFAVAWPLSIVGISWVVWRTYRRHPTVARREDVVVALAVIIGFFTLLGNLAILSGDPAMLFSPELGLLCGTILYVTGIGHVDRYGDRHDRRYGSETDDERRLALPVYLATGGLLALLAAGYNSGPVGVLVLIAGFALLAFAGALGVTKYYYL